MILERLFTVPPLVANDGIRRARGRRGHERLRGGARESRAVGRRRFGPVVSGRQ